MMIRHVAAELLSLSKHGGALCARADGEPWAALRLREPVDPREIDIVLAREGVWNWRFSTGGSPSDFGAIGYFGIQCARPGEMDSAGLASLWGSWELEEASEMGLGAMKGARWRL